MIRLPAHLVAGIGRHYGMLLPGRCQCFTIPPNSVKVKEMPPLMTIPIHIPDELAIQAARRSMDVAAYVEQILNKEVATVKPVLPRAPRLTQEEFDTVLDGLAEFSDKIPHLPDSAFTREAIYSDHD